MNKDFMNWLNCDDPMDDPQTQLAKDEIRGELRELSKEEGKEFSVFYKYYHFLLKEGYIEYIAARLAIQSVALEHTFKEELMH